MDFFFQQEYLMLIFLEFIPSFLLILFKFRKFYIDFDYEFLKFGDVLLGIGLVLIHHLLILISLILMLFISCFDRLKSFNMPFILSIHFFLFLFCLHMLLFFIFFKLLLEVYQHWFYLLDVSTKLDLHLSSVLEILQFFVFERSIILKGPIEYLLVPFVETIVWFYHLSIEDKHGTGHFYRDVFSILLNRTLICIFHRFLIQRTKVQIWIVYTV